MVLIYVDIVNRSKAIVLNNKRRVTAVDKKRHQKAAAAQLTQHFPDLLTPLFTT